jgi:DNA-binding GntR family transcriptional regulator
VRAVSQRLSAGRRASDIVEERLTQMIVSLELPPGTMVEEAVLMERLGCGRTPLREALQRLAQEYLVVSIPRKGVRIAEADLSAYAQLMEAASHFEAVAARLAASNADAGHLERLEGNLAAAARAGLSRDLLAAADLDHEFHLAVAECGGNRYVVDAATRLQRLATRFLYLAMERGLTGWESLDEHKLILAAIKTGDEDEAARQTRRHWLGARDRVVAALLPELGPTSG